VTSIGVGGVLGALSAFAAGWAILPLATGIVGVVLGTAYLASPTWRLRVVADDDGLEVGTPAKPRFRLAWTDVVRVIASPSTRTCFVDGGDPSRSLLVPGDGAPAPYWIENRDALYRAIVEHVSRDRITEVETLASK
jgi:hypothetical protein